ncbi:MAG: AAA family ATPase [Vicinamibacteria bacterium]|nr:AAA family ATPase [Vicinamibacteria bacterium]
MRYDGFLSRLEGVHRTGDDKATAKCPAHDDQRASLSVGIGGDGRILLKCFAGCETLAIIKALGLTMADLMPAREPKSSLGEIVDTYDYVDERGEPLYQVVRYAPKNFRQRRPDGNGWTWNLERVRRVLFRLPTVIETAKKGGMVVVCEGEKDALTVEKLGYVATTNAGGAGKWRPEYTASLSGCRGVVVLPHRDEPGRKHAEAVARSLHARNVPVKIVELPVKDVTDWVAAGRVKDELDAIIKAAARWTPITGLRMLHDAVPDAVANLERFHKGDFSRAIPSGLASLDCRLGGGLQRGQLLLLGAPTGNGKTTIVSQIAISAAQRGPVLLVSPEMSAGELAEREIIRRSRTRKYARAPWGAGDRTDAKTRHESAANAIGDECLPIAILDKPDATMEDVDQAASDLHKQNGGLSLVLIDYAQQVAPIDPKTPRYLSVGSIATKSIELARRLDCAVLVASQVNVVKERSSPTSYVFRETALLEHKAHTVLLFVVEWSTPDEDGDRYVKDARFCASKMRNGSCFDLPVKYTPSLYLIEESASR